MRFRWRWWYWRPSRWRRNPRGVRLLSADRPPLADFAVAECRCLPSPPPASPFIPPPPASSPSDTRPADGRPRPHRRRGFSRPPAGTRRRRRRRRGGRPEGARAAEVADGRTGGPRGSSSRRRWSLLAESDDWHTRRLMSSLSAARGGRGRGRGARPCRSAPPQPRQPPHRIYHRTAAAASSWCSAEAGGAGGRTVT